MIKSIINTVLIKLAHQWYIFTRMLTKKGRKELELDDINEKLSEALIEKSSSKISLRRKILRDYATRKPARSKFIPTRVKSAEKIKKEVEAKYGAEMREVNLKITDKLELK